MHNRNVYYNVSIALHIWKAVEFQLLINKNILMPFSVVCILMYENVFVFLFLLQSLPPLVLMFVSSSIFPSSSRAVFVLLVSGDAAGRLQTAPSPWMSSRHLLCDDQVLVSNVSCQTTPNKGHNV